MAQCSNLHDPTHAYASLTASMVTTGELEQKGPYSIELLDGENAAKIVDFIEPPSCIVVKSLNQFIQPAY